MPLAIQKNVPVILDLFIVQEGLPETVRQTKERVLKSLKKELSKQATDKKNKKLSKQYKMVKFFGESCREDKW